ncbi:MAG: hypothetical protein PHI23_04550 [Candidatus Peribacteraceae bacterium]|nr:hypothetical protein [Candidatus Peribacteraceae bacterium]
MDTRFIVGIIGSIVLVVGVVTPVLRWKDLLFTIGNACMFTYALLGYLAGGPIFFLILQIFIALSTLCMLLHVPDKYDTTILALAGVGLTAWSLSLFEGYTTAIFVVGLVLLGIGFALQGGTFKREVALMVGSVVIAAFSYLVKDWIFTGLNVVFALGSLWNASRMTLRRAGV